MSALKDLNQTAGGMGSRWREHSRPGTSLCKGFKATERIVSENRQGVQCGCSEGEKR